MPAKTTPKKIVHPHTQETAAGPRKSGKTLSHESSNGGQHTRVGVGIHKKEKVLEVAVEKYVERVGRRKTAIARVRITPGEKRITINGRKLEEYFTIPRLSLAAMAPLTALHMENMFSVGAKVVGGGVKAQAEAVRLGLARALVSVDPELKKRLKKLGFLTRDSRAVERKKYGLKKARRAPQWSKR